MHNITTELARFVAASQLETVSEATRDEAVRALVNWLGCALGGCLDPAVESAMDTLASARGPVEATLVGRGERTDVLSATLFGAMSADVLDYGDTHPRLRIGVSAAVAGAVFPLAEARASSGAQVLHAFLLGAETTCRIARALGTERPGHREEASAVCGMVGAAAACAKLLGLDALRTAHAIGIAATQASAAAESDRHESRLVSLGIAARNGASAALLAEQAFTGSADSLDAPKGLLDGAGMEARPEDLLEGLGTHWQFASLGYHAYACDHALHTAVEACLQLKRKYDLSARSIEEVVVRLHPARSRYVELTHPASPADARHSLHHVVAVALLDGEAGTRQFAPARVANDRVRQFRARVRARLDSDNGEDAACVSVRLRDGRHLEAQVRCPLGHPQRPLGSLELNAKFRALAAETLATDQAERLLALAWNVAALPDVGALMRAGVPEYEIEAAELPGSPLLPR